MIRAIQAMMAALFLLALSSQSDQITDDDFLLQILPGILSATLHKQLPEQILPDEPKPTITISAREIEAFYFQFEAKISGLDTPISNYTWTFGDGLQASGRSSSHRYSAPREYTVGLAASTAKGEKYFVEKKVNVRLSNKLPVANISLGPSNGYAPLTVQFDASASFDEDGSILSYHWAFGDGLTAMGPRVAHQYQSQGIYTRYAASLTVTDDRQGQHRTTQYVSVNRADNRPVASFDMSAEKAEAPTIIKFDASDSFDLDGYIVEYLWDFDDGYISSGKRTRHTFTKAGEYYPLLTVTDNSGDTQTFSRQLVIAPKNQDPAAVFSVSSGGSAAPAMITFNAGDSSDEDGLIVSYHWDFGDGHTGEGIMTTHVYKQPGDYIATLYVTDHKDGVGIARHLQLITGLTDLERGLSILSSGGETTDNPYTLSGHADAGVSVQIYVDAVLYQTITADDLGGWALPVPLQDGLNIIKAQVGEDAYSESHAMLLKYLNHESRDLSGKVVNDILVLTPGIPPQPYVVDDTDLSIAEDGKLVLQAGVEIQFNGPDWPVLSVNGILDVRGDEDHKVLLTSDYLDENGELGKWSGINIAPEALYVKISHAVIDRTNWAVDSVSTPVMIENTRIHQGVIELVGVGENSVIKDSQLEGYNSGVSIYGDSYVSIRGNTFAPETHSIRVDCYASGCPIIDINGNNLLMDKPVYLHDNYIRQRGDQPLDARGNWWGTTDIHQIGNSHLDTRGFLDGPVPTGERFAGEIFDQQNVPHVVDQNLILQQDGDHLAYSDITVPPGVKLTLEAGATLRLDSQYSGVFDLIVKGELVLEEGARIDAEGFNAIIINGGLRINGSEQMPIVFNSVQDAPGHEDWAGIQINSAASNVSIYHALIQHAHKGVSFRDSSGVLSNTELRDNKYGVWIEGNSEPFLTGNTITANETGIFDRADGTIEGAQPQIRRNNLAGNQQYSIYLAWHQAADEIRSFRENWWGSTDISAIFAQIFDGYDASNHPFVDYSDYLDGPVPEGEIYRHVVREISLINVDTTLRQDERIIVVGDVYIAQGVTLTLAANTRLIMPGNAATSFNLIVDGALVLEAGAVIEFAGTGQTIEINGSMTAQGAAENPIVFSSSEPNRAVGDWQGIHVRPTTSHFLLRHVQIQYAKRGIWFDGVSGEVHSSHFEQNGVAVLGSGIANPDLQANTFKDNYFDVQILGVSINDDNQSPVAEFTSSKAADSVHSTVHFSAEDSSDDSRIIAYHWDLSDGSVASGSEVSFDFQGVDERVVKLTVLDEHGATGQLIRTIRYSLINASPVAIAGVDQIVHASDQVFLDASSSYDDAGIVAYSWMQVQGPTVMLSDAAATKPSFTMPELEAGKSLMFELSVQDAQSLTSTDVVNIDLHRNLSPRAVAGRDQSVETGHLVSLDGTFSTARDGEIVTYQWVQSEGPPVNLLTPGNAVASFTMPDLAEDQSLIFDLSVTDNEGLMASDQVVISRIKEVALNANVSSGIAPLNVSFRIDSKIPVAWVNMNFEGNGVADISQAKIGQFSFPYELPGTYQPYVGVRDDQGEWYFDRMTIVVSDPVQVWAAIKLEWDAMVLALLAGNIDTAMQYVSDDRREEFSYMFDAMGSDRLQVIFEGVEDIQLNEVSGGYAEIAVLRRQNGQLYAYPVGMIKDENGVWKILKM